MRDNRLTVSDVVILAAATLVIASLTLIHLQEFRASARQSACASKLFRQVLALHNYHSAYKQMPMGSGGTTSDPGALPWQSNQGRLSAFVALTPFSGNQALWEQISNPLVVDDRTFPSMGPVPWYDPAIYQPWKQRPAGLVCPSDPDAQKFAIASSYVMNFGDAVHMVGSPYDPADQEVVQAVSASNRGMFFGTHVLKLRDVRDGLSNTVLFSEACIASTRVARDVEGLILNPSLCLDAQDIQSQEFWPEARDACWADGSLRSSGFQTILPPNSPSATIKRSDLEGIMSVSSFHPGGAHAALADGAIRFVSESIDTGANDSPTVATLPGTAKPKSESPYGVWGALGTRASFEKLDTEPVGLLVPWPRLTNAEREAIQRKPQQSWRLVDGSSLQGVLVCSYGNRLIYWSSDANKLRQISLSKLVPTDAQAVNQQYRRMQKRSLLRLKVQCNAWIKSLKSGQLDQFNADVVESDSYDQKRLESLVKSNSEYLIEVLEAVLRELDSPDSNAIRFAISEYAPVVISLKELRRSPLGPIQLGFANERWTIHVTN